LSINKGFISIEALVVIILLVLSITFFILLLDVIRIEMLIQYSCDMTAIEFSRYANVFSAFEVDHMLVNKSNNINKMYNDLHMLLENSQNYIDNGENKTWEEVRTGLKKAKLNYERIKEWFKYPDKLKRDISSFLFENSIDFIVSSSGKLIIENIFSNYFKPSQINNPFLEVSNFSLMDSNLFTEDGNITIRTNYTLKLTIPFILNKELQNSVTANTRAFLGNKIEKPNIHSVWLNKNYWWRGKYIISQEMELLSYSVPEISGVHGAELSNEYLKLYRVFSFDTFRKTNDLEQFEETVTRHLNTFMSKVTNINNISLEDKDGNVQKILLNKYVLEKEIIVVVPENITTDIKQNIEDLLHKYQDDNNIKLTLKLAYGNSQYD
jgi:hypothetical protein